MMTEVFEELCVTGNIIEDWVIYLLGSLSDSFNILVTALEANSEVACWEIVTGHYFMKR